MNKSLWLILLSFSSFIYAANYSVGPGKTYATIGAVPLENLSAGDSLLIYWRSEPYREKLVLTGNGTAQKPIVVRGMPGPNGQRPVLDGENATTRTQLNFWGEERAIIKIGGSTNPSGNATHIRIEGLEIRNARQGVAFTSRTGTASTYIKAASAIYVESGSDITVSDCVMHSNGNGFFTAYESSRITLQFSHLYGNGYVGDILHHNSYTESKGITFLGNRYGLLLDGALGNNLKDRSVGTRIVNNYIEGGNRQLDLVESAHLTVTTARETITEVYGNILIEPPNAGNRQIVHFGGDDTDTSRHRETLHFAYNTVISRRTDATTLFRVAHPRQQAIAINNTFYTRHAGSTLYIQDGNGHVQLGNNWMREGYRTHPTDASLHHTDLGGNFFGIQGIQSVPAQLFSKYVESDSLELKDSDLHPPHNSVLIGQSRYLDSDTGFWYLPITEYEAHQGVQVRRDTLGYQRMNTVGAQSPTSGSTGLLHNSSINPTYKSKERIHWFNLNGRRNLKRTN